MERGEIKLTIDRLQDIADLYNITLADLLNMNVTNMIHSITADKGVGFCNSDVTINNSISESERELFQKTIARLEQENDRLLQIIERITNGPK